MSRPLAAQIWDRAENDHYVEPEWCASRLFDEEEFTGSIHDPCCGFGTIPKAAAAHGFIASGSDLVDRGFGKTGVDFLSDTRARDNVVCNPPFGIIQEFIAHALAVTEYKVAAIIPVARLNAARWLSDTPLMRVWLLTPRPSMPPGHVIAAGARPGGGKADFCWLIWSRGHNGPVELRWLRRDRA